MLGDLFGKLQEAKKATKGIMPDIPGMF